MEGLFSESYSMLQDDLIVQTMLIKKFIVGYQNEVTFKADLHRIQVSIKHHNRFKSS